MKTTIWFSATFLLLAASALRAQTVQPSQFSSLGLMAQPQASSLPNIDSASADSVFGSLIPDPVMIANRARTLGDTLSGSMTHYFFAQDQDLLGLSPEQVLQRLSPTPVNAGYGPRTIEVFIDLNRPITVAPQPGQPADIGTVVIHGSGPGHIQVYTTILTNGVRVLPH